LLFLFIFPLGYYLKWIRNYLLIYFMIIILFFICYGIIQLENHLILSGLNKFSSLFLQVRIYKSLFCWNFKYKEYITSLLLIFFPSIFVWNISFFIWTDYHLEFNKFVRKYSKILIWIQINHFFYYKFFIIICFSFND
jgi:hypothetical protein